jgi:hypothetical protein
MPRQITAIRHRNGFRISPIVLPILEKNKTEEDSTQGLENLTVVGTISSQLHKKLNNATQSTKKLNKFIKFSI